MKTDAVFGCEKAGWPALLVTAEGGVLASNAAAKKIFGVDVNGPPPKLAALWAPENELVPGDFFKAWEKNPAAVTGLKFRTTGEGVLVFSTAVCPATQQGQAGYLLQLLPPASDGALKQKLDCVMQLARTVALDFNNALTGVLAHTSLLISKAETDHPWRRSLIEVEKSAARAAEIAGELALFSRQEKAARRIPPGDLNLAVSRCAESFRDAQGPRFTWKTNLERSLYVARFDEAKVQQALSKLLDNAVEAYAPDASGQITVSTRNMDLTEPTQDRNVRLAAGAYVCVEISDTGAGIDAESQLRIFEPFFTTKRPPHRGLGLAFVYGIITNHGGGVAVSSQPGKGSSARLYLPAEKSLTREVDGSDRNLHGSGTILVVDDEVLLLTLAVTILSEYGYTVLTANSSQKALALLAQSDAPVNLVITDLVMPGMSGRELIEHIRLLDDCLPIICTSGYVMPKEQKAGASYLQKPFTSTELLMKVKAALAPAKPAD